MSTRRPYVTQKIGHRPAENLRKQKSNSTADRWAGRLADLYLLPYPEKWSKNSLPLSRTPPSILVPL